MATVKRRAIQFQPKQIASILDIVADYEDWSVTVEQFTIRETAYTWVVLRLGLYMGMRYEMKEFVIDRDGNRFELAQAND